MNWLLHNPIADLYGPHFLVLYAVVIAVTWAVCGWKVRAADPTAAQPPPVPADLDPLVLAYLKGGENELVRLVVFELIQRGYLEIVQEKKWLFTTENRIAQVRRPPDPRHLTPLELDVFRWFGSPALARDIFSTANGALPLPQRVKGYCFALDDRLRSEELLMPEGMKATALKILVPGLVVILGLGGYKFAVALAKQHYNVGFLVGGFLVGTLALTAICHPRRQSRCGREYLKRIETQLAPAKSRCQHDAGVDDSTLLLLVSVFGLSILTHTAYASLATMFRQSAASSGGCGGGCGGGGCGGGGCGGGCGGCGG